MESPLVDESLCNIPQFLAKLWCILEDPETDEVISWTDDGKAFTVHDQAVFSRVLLPKYFKHGNFFSFVRQLNLYDFHKLSALMSGMIEEKFTFAHNSFHRDGVGRLMEIQRKGYGRVRMPSDGLSVGRMVSTSKEFNNCHNRLVRKFRELKKSRKEIRQGLAELQLWLAEKGGVTISYTAQTKAVTLTSEAVGSSAGDQRLHDFSGKQQSDVTDAVEVIRQGTEVLRETSRQMGRQHRLHMKELRMALCSRYKLASLEKEDWALRIKAAEQELANHQLEHTMLSKQLEYQRMCNVAANDKTGAPPLEAKN